MKPLTIINKDITGKSLLKLAEKIEGAWIGIRIAGLLLILLGWKTTEIAKLFGISRQSVIAWITKANEDGLKGIEDKVRAGRPSQLSKQVSKELVKALKKAPEEYGMSRFRWDGIVVVEFLKKTFAITIKPRQARNWLKKLGFVRKKAIHSYIQATEHGVGAFKKGLKKKSKESKRD